MFGGGGGCRHRRRRRHHHHHHHHRHHHYYYVISNVAPRSRCTEKPMDSADFHRVEQELQQQLYPMSALHTKGLQYTQGWSTASLGKPVCMSK